MRSLVSVCVATLAVVPTVRAQDQTEALSTALPIAFGLPRVVAMNAYASRNMVVEAVYQATALSGGGMIGRIVNTGTLAPGYGGGFQYSPQPTDRLLVNLGPGQVHEFVVHQAQGNNQAATASQWLMSPHILRYTHRLGDQADGEMTTQFNGVQFDTHVLGWYVHAGIRYEVNLKATGQTTGTRDYHGQDTQTQYDLAGTISGGDLEIEVNERHSSSLVSATNLRLLPSQRGSASRFNAVLNNLLRIGGVEYQFQNVQLQTDQRTRGTTSGQAGLTMLDGMLTQYGQPFGRFVLHAGRAFLQTQSVMIPLDTPVGGAGS